MDEYDVPGASEPQSPIQTTSEDVSVLSGATLIGSESDIDIPRPKFTTEYVALQPKDSTYPTQQRPALSPPADQIDDRYSFYHGLGWVRMNSEKRNYNKLGGKLVEYLTDSDYEIGIVYIFKHRYYDNLYKIGCAEDQEKRIKSMSPCFRSYIEKPAAHTTKEMCGYKRVEALVHIDMAARKVPLQICQGCSKGGKTKEHREWFTGDLEEIKRCVEYWAEAVKRSIKEGGFHGNFWEIMERGLSSQERRVKSRQEFGKPRSDLGRSPCLHRGTKPVRRPKTDCTSTSTSPEEEEEEEEESERAEEAFPNTIKVIFPRRDTSDSIGFTAPNKQASRAPKSKISGIPGRPVTRLAKKEWNSMSLRSGDVSRAVKI